MKGTIEMNRQKWLEMLLKHIGKAVLATDTDGNISYVNETACQLLGIQAGDATGVRIKEVLKLQDEADGHEVQLPLQQVIQKNQFFNMDRGLLLVDGQGKIRQVTYAASPLRNEARETIGAVFVLCQHDFNLDTLKPPAGVRSKSEPEPFPDYFFVKKDGNFFRVKAEEVLYVEAMENYALMVTENDRYTLHTTLKNLECRLRPFGFVRVHRSYVVPTSRIDVIEDNRLRIGPHTVPIGKSFKARLMDQLYFV